MNAVSVEAKLRPKGLIFDLDGTLVDSFADLATAVNLTRRSYGEVPLSLPDVRRHVGNGVEHLVRQTVPVPAERWGEALNRFLSHYDDHVCDETQVLPGVAKVLGHFADRQLAIVTNKTQHFTDRILAALGLDEPFAVVLGGDALPKKKPDPAPLLEVLSRLGLAADEVMMIGDGVNDVRAGRAAGVRTIALTTGVEDAATLQAEGPDHLLTHMAQVLDLLD